METTPFDLSLAIQQWRKDLEQLPAFKRENLDELEAHLRDSVAQLQSRGLSARESFYVGSNRLGTGQELEAEFVHVNQTSVWRDRALWMLAGMIFLFIVGGCINAAFSAVIYMGSMFSSDGIKLGWGGIAARSTAFAILAWIFWRLANGHFNALGKTAGRFKSRPVLWVLGIVICLALVNATQFFFQMLYTRNVGPMALGQSYAVMSWWFAVFPLLQGALAIVGFTILWQKRISRMAAGRLAAWALIVPVAMGLMLASANAETNTATTKSVAAEKPAPVTLDQAMTLWRAGKTNEAAATFLAVDFTKRPLFPFGSVLNYTEAQFVALPDAAREKMSKQMMDDIQVLKQISAHVRDMGESAEAAGDKTKAAACRAQLLKGGAAFNQPDSLALLKLVGKALMKMSMSGGKN